MIAKEIKAIKATNSVDKLIKYITNPEKLGDRDYTSISNCSFGDDLQITMKEITSTQAQNTRAKTNKTYHMIVSFEEGENPTEKELVEVERRIVESIGYKDHQRVSALHTDTNNTHLHIVINRIHPETFNLINTFNDHKEMHKECRALESELGLRTYNQRVGNEHTNGRAGDMEAHQSIESFTGWLQREALGEIHTLLNDKKRSYKELHKLLDKFNVSLEKRTNGLVFKDNGSDIRVKASSVDRAFSKRSLEKILDGDFVEKGGQTNGQPKTKYTRETLSNENHSPLYKDYLRYKEETKHKRDRTIKGISSKRKVMVNTALDEINKRLKDINSSLTMDWKDQKEIRTNLFIQKKRIVEEGHTYYAEQRALLNDTDPVLNWVGFLQREAKQGNESAVEALRKNKSTNISSNYSYYSDKLFWDGIAKNNSVYSDMKYHIDKRGRVQYIISDDDRIFVDKNGIRPTNYNKETVKVCLDIALRQYGKDVNIHGSDKFIEAIKEQAKKRNIKINIQQVSIGR